MNTTSIVARLDNLIVLGTGFLSKAAGRGNDIVALDDYYGFKTASLSLILSLYGDQHPFYTSYNNEVGVNKTKYVKLAIGIIRSVKIEVENGWLTTVRQLVTAEVFSDFLEMADHLVEGGYKDAATVMIGSVLEEHLRQLCATHKVDTNVLKGTDNLPKPASLMNDDLKKAGAYGPLEQKQVVAWLGLRNSAAHGKYDEYKIEQVRLMYQGVLDFISRVK